MEPVKNHLSLATLHNKAIRVHSFVAIPERDYTGDKRYVLVDDIPTFRNTWNAIGAE